MEMRPIDPLERVAVLDRWESNQKRDRRRAAWSAWASVVAAGVVLAALIYFGHRDLAAVQKQVEDKQGEIREEQAKLDKLQQATWYFALKITKGACCP